jgi:hypothetical protein
MPTEVFDDVQELEIGLLEAEMPTSTEDSSYPYPSLRPTGESIQRGFRLAVLENPHLKITVAPSLGGRILSILDKRTNRSILPLPKALLSQPGGRRGAHLPVGIELTLNGQERPNSLGHADIGADPAEDDESPAGLWIAESIGGTGLSFHLHLSLPPDQAEIQIEARVLNRTLTPLPYNGGFRIHAGPGNAIREHNGLRFYSSERDAGFLIAAQGSLFDAAGYDGQCIRFERFDRLRLLEPRQVDTFTLTLTPFSDLGDMHGASRHAGASLTDDEVRILASKDAVGHKLLLLTESGQTLEAPVDLLTGAVVSIPLSDLPARPVELVLLSPSKQELLRLDRQPATPLPPLDSHSPQAPQSYPISPASNDLELSQAAFDIRLRHVAHLLQGYRALAGHDYESAEIAFERSLLFNAEDPLTWWIKALTSRLRNGPGEERSELLNAHFLAPAEPALRAEAFLSQSQEMGKEPSPLVAALDENPEAFVEVAALLVEAGLDDQATRWIDEALRHQDLAMLRYLQGFCFLRASRMQVEAAECVAAAARLGFVPPFPWRTVEWQAIEALSERFPDDPVLRRYRGLR